MEDESDRRLTMVAQMNIIRIDFFRPQMAHALKAKITRKGVSAAGVRKPGLGLTFGREDSKNTKTWFPWSRYASSSSVGTYSFSRCSSPPRTWVFQDNGRARRENCGGTYWQQYKYCSEESGVSRAGK